MQITTEENKTREAWMHCREQSGGLDRSTLCWKTLLGDGGFLVSMILLSKELHLAFWLALER